MTKNLILIKYVVVLSVCYGQWFDSCVKVLCPLAALICTKYRLKKQLYNLPQFPPPIFLTPIQSLEIPLILPSLCNHPGKTHRRKDQWSRQPSTRSILRISHNPPPQKTGREKKNQNHNTNPALPKTNHSLTKCIPATA